MKNVFDKVNARWIVTIAVTVVSATGIGFLIGLWMAG